MIDPVLPAAASGSSNIGSGIAVDGANTIASRGVSAASAVTPFAAQSSDFATVLARVALNAVEALKAGEATAVTGIQGKASVQQVVEAVASAEQTLQTAIVVRDKVVAAYLELSRMQI